MDKVNMVPGFILKLWKMINDPECDDLISWSNNGQSFIIMDPPRFSQELSKYFKHNNLSSFIRQLNMYGFRKVASIENSGLHPGTDDLHFYHPDFVRDQPNRLDSIKRKLPQKLAESVDFRNVSTVISEIENKQNDVAKTLADMRRENQLLWNELAVLRRKHEQQQLYISKLIVLVQKAMEQNGIKANIIQLERNSSPLMIQGIETVPEVSTPEQASNGIETPQPLVKESTLGQVEIDDCTPYQINDLYQSCGVDAITFPMDDQDCAAYQLSDSNQIPYQVGDDAAHDFLSTPTTSYDMGDHLSSVPNLERAIDENAEQIDKLVPQIADFPAAENPLGNSSEFD